jgi:hypothetical protein
VQVVPNAVRRNVYKVFPADPAKCGTAFLLPVNYELHGSRVLLTCRHCVIHDETKVPPEPEHLYIQDWTGGRFKVGFKFFDTYRKECPNGADDLDLAVLYFPSGFDTPELPEGLEFGGGLGAGAVSMRCSFVCTAGWNAVCTHLPCLCTSCRRDGRGDTAAAA